MFKDWEKVVTLRNTLKREKEHNDKGEKPNPDSSKSNEKGKKKEKRACTEYSKKSSSRDSNNI